MIQVSSMHLVSMDERGVKINQSPFMYIWNRHGSQEHSL